MIQLFEAELISMYQLQESSIYSFGNRYYFLLNLFRNHFLLPECIDQRIDSFILKAIQLVNRISPDQFGFCPTHLLPEQAQYYTFHLKQLCRLCIATGVDMNKENTSSTFYSLVPTDSWKLVYSSFFPLQTNGFEVSSHHQIIYRQFELVVAGVISKLMDDYLICTFNSMISESLNTKTAILEFFQWKIQRSKEH
jgi:hypothetical protein